MSLAGHIAGDGGYNKGWFTPRIKGYMKTIIFEILLLKKEIVCNSNQRERKRERKIKNEGTKCSREKKKAKGMKTVFREKKITVKCIAVVLISDKSTRDDSSKVGGGGGLGCFLRVHRHAWKKFLGTWQLIGDEVSSGRKPRKGHKS